LFSNYLQIMLKSSLFPVSCFFQILDDQPENV
jgi:hypothetical protein